MNVREKRGGKGAEKKVKQLGWRKLTKGGDEGNQHIEWQREFILLTRQVRIDLEDLDREDVFLFVATVAEAHGYLCI